MPAPNSPCPKLSGTLFSFERDVLTWCISWRGRETKKKPTTRTIRLAVGRGLSKASTNVLSRAILCLISADRSFSISSGIDQIPRCCLRARYLEKRGSIAAQKGRTSRRSRRRQTVGYFHVPAYPVTGNISVYARENFYLAISA